MSDVGQVEVEARTLGWVPQEEFRGDTAQWVDAETFVKRGQEILPIVRGNNKRLVAEVNGLKELMAKQSSELRGALTVIKQLEESREEDVREQVKSALAELRQGIAEASSEGDHAKVAELTERLVDLKQASADAKGRDKAQDKLDEATGGTSKEPQVNPVFAAWHKDNEWFGQDKKRTALTLAIAEEKRASGDTRTTAAFMDDCGKEAAETLHPTPRSSKVEGGGGAPSGGSGGGAKGYTSLPAEAKTVCDKQGQAFVGKGRKYKTMDEWRSRYAELYYQE